MVFHNKSMVRSSYMMMTMLIICYRDPMCQIHTQWWHFSALIGYCSFDDVLSQKYGQVIINDDHHVHNLLKGPHVPNSYAVGTLFGVDGFYCSFDDVSSQKYGQVIINYNIFKERCVATHQANRQLLGITLRWWWMNERICTLVHVLLTLSGGLFWGHPSTVPYRQASGGVISRI